ncbi:MAG TPA: selenocysteine-specific translation elongation factor [Phycisphaerae bacterium]|nr:selenocysteine-specific translation elongation factor [Phycisphaerae bacterium]
MTTARKNILLGTAGHVDHGKTALVKLLTGCDTDRLTAEKDRGLTIELGFAPCRMRDERIVGIVDVPGHVDFIRNMVAGAHGIDVVLLVVAADDSIMPQTREHLDILTLMGVRHGIVALTKIDLVDADLRRIVEEDVRTFVGGTFLEGAPICGISNVTGDGFEGFFAALDQAVAACEPHPSTGLFRLWIERAFAIRGYGTVLSGVPTSGEVHLGDRLAILPGGLTGRVRHLEVYGEETETARAGECVAVNLAGVETEKIETGMAACAGDAFEPVTVAEAELSVLPHVPHAMKDYLEVHLHIGTARATARIAILDDKAVPPGERRMVQLRLDRPLALAPGDRFVVRAGMAGLADGRVTTLGGGRILGTSNRRLRRNRPEVLQALADRLDALDDPAAWCTLCLKESGEALDPGALARRALAPEEQVRPILERLCGEGAVVAVGERFVHRDVVDAAAGRLRGALEAFHLANPRRAGVAPADLLKEVGLSPAVFDQALERLVAEKAAVRSVAVIALAGRGSRVSAEDQALSDRIEALLREGGLAPAGPTEMVEALHAPADRVAAMLRLLADEGRVVQLNDKVVMYRDAVEAARRAVLDLFARKRGFETTEFRDALGVSRKFAVPLLDYFDTVRLTVRTGSRRTPGAEARRALAEKPKGG